MRPPITPHSEAEPESLCIRDRQTEDANIGKNGLHLMHSMQPETLVITGQKYFSHDHRRLIFQLILGCIECMRCRLLLPIFAVSVSLSVCLSRMHQMTPAG